MWVILNEVFHGGEGGVCGLMAATEVSEELSSGFLTHLLRYDRIYTQKINWPGQNDGPCPTLGTLLEHPRDSLR